MAAKNKNETKTTGKPEGTPGKGKPSGDENVFAEAGNAPESSPGAKTTIRVAATNSAAKDDTFSAEGTEWLAESGELVGTLNVLANDPGSASMFAVHGEMPEGSGPVEPSNEATIVIEHNGEEFEVTVMVNDDGTLEVDLSGLSGNLDLAEGETLEATFYYTAQMGKNGVLSTAAVTLEIVGEDSDAEITGEDTGTVQEDGTLEAAGILTVADNDAGEDAFEAPEDASLAGVFGDFTFDAETGEWGYLLRNEDENVQLLNTGDVETDTLTVTSLDGSATHDIVVTIEGADEPEPEPGEEPVELANGGFESGLEGFSTFGSVGAVGSSTAGGANVDPTEGDMMAGLSTEPDFTGDPATTEELETGLGLEAGALSDLGNGDAAGGSAASTTLFLAAGETVSFDYRFQTQEDTTVNDFAFVSVNGSEVEELADVESVGDFGDSGWQTYSYTATEDGNIDLAVGVVDSGDDFGTSTLFVDNLTIA